MTGGLGLGGSTARSAECTLAIFGVRVNPFGRLRVNRQSFFRYLPVFLARMKMFRSYIAKPRLWFYKKLFFLPLFVLLDILPISMTLKIQIARKAKKDILTLWPDLAGRFADGSLVVDVVYPPEEKFGAYTTNIALHIAPFVEGSPRDVAAKIAEQFSLPAVAKTEVAGPGFINFFLKPQWLIRLASLILKEKARYGCSAFGLGKRVDVEFISANPTGPLTLGNGRGAFMGDTLANVLACAGYRVQRDYYVNDMGNQVNILAESVLRRYWQSQGIQMEYPEYCYQGQYIDDIARTLYLPNYKLGNNSLIEIRDKIKGRILKKMLGNIRRFVRSRLGIHFDVWFSEKSLYTSKKIDTMLETLRKMKLVYEQEGALWMRTTSFGDDKDRVLIRANNEPTYFLPDIAYHYEKFSRRKFSRVINFLGADHAGYAPRMQAAMQALGFGGKLTIIVFQLVRLISGGIEVRMSKRKGTFVTFEELIDEVGVDAARYFFLMHAASTHMDFDLDLAKKRSDENPVYYVQYAHARICSILRKTKEFSRQAREPSGKDSEVDPSSQRLLVKLGRWPEILEDVAETYAIHKLPAYAYELATCFHEFYTNVRVIEQGVVREGPLRLVQSTKQVLSNVLGIMGISAPEKM